MGYTSDNAPDGNPFSQSYKDFVSGMAKDIVDLMRYKPMLDQLSQDVQGGGAGEDSVVFPAAILANHGSWNDNSTLGKFYEFEEVLHPKTTQYKPNGRSSNTGSITTVAVNTLEVGLVSSPVVDMYIPPGLRGACLENAAPAPGDLNINFFISPISSYPKTVVMMTYFGPVEVVDGVFYDVYYFSCPVALCAGCDVPNGGEQNVQRQQDEIRNTSVTPESITRPNDMDTDTGQSRGYFDNSDYSP
jgi:hypothetical protein